MLFSNMVDHGNLNKTSSHSFKIRVRETVREARNSLAKYFFGKIPCQLLQIMVLVLNFSSHPLAFLICIHTRNIYTGKNAAQLTNVNRKITPETFPTIKLRMLMRTALSTPSVVIKSRMSVLSKNRKILRENFALSKWLNILK